MIRIPLWLARLSRLGLKTIFVGPFRHLLVPRARLTIRQAVLPTPSILAERRCTLSRALLQGATARFISVWGSRFLYRYGSRWIAKGRAFHPSSQTPWPA